MAALGLGIGCNPAPAAKRASAAGAVTHTATVAGEQFQAATARTSAACPPLRGDDPDDGTVTYGNAAALGIEDAEHGFVERARPETRCARAKAAPAWVSGDVN
jgi:hypothetical protein